MPRQVFISVAEVSGDLHAAELIRALRELDPEIEIEGIGGPEMLAAGAVLMHETVGRAAMGVRGIFRALEVLKLMRQIKARYATHPPDLHICIDSSAMNLPIARLARSMNVPVLYYIAPQLWASREGRMKKLRRDVDRVACILPFEEKYFRAHGVNATFVGHPLFDKLPLDRESVIAQAREHRFPDSPPRIGIVPGSRRGEVRDNFPHLLDVAQRIQAEYSSATFLIPTTPAVEAMVIRMLDAVPGALRRAVMTKVNAFDELIPQCDLCLCKSGTSTLHVAAWGVPMIVVYRLNPMLWHTIGRLLIKTPKIALVNILAGNIDLVPEFVPWHGSNEPVANLALAWLRDPEKLRGEREKLQAFIRTIESRGASRNTARIVNEMIHSRGS